MKKLALMLVALMITSLTFAQKIQDKNVPAQVKTAFQKQYPNASDVKWDKEGEKFEASFDLNKIDNSVLFDAKGNVLETEVEIDVSALPFAIQSTLKKDFAGFKINEASKIESLKNGNCYEAEIEKGEETFDVLLTLDGKVLSKTVVEEKEMKD